MRACFLLSRKSPADPIDVCGGAFAFCYEHELRIVGMCKWTRPILSLQGMQLRWGGIQDIALLGEARGLGRAQCAVRADVTGGYARLDGMARLCLDDYMLHSASTRVCRLCLVF